MTIHRKILMILIACAVIILQAKFEDQVLKDESQEAGSSGIYNEEEMIDV